MKRWEERGEMRVRSGEWTVVIKDGQDGGQEDGWVAAGTGGGGN